MAMDLSYFKNLAKSSPHINEIPEKLIEEGLLIRLVEEKFLDLFSQGKMNGTVHTCVGQEFSAIAVAGQLTELDWVTSNHRCHGHFISKTKNWKGLIDELVGIQTGACQGIGSSQHLFAKGFLSNGPQAALVPVASGIALYNKINLIPGIAVSYIGEGTLGEGVMYESLNLISLKNLPHLIVCENNLYSQSTPQSKGIAGSISDRPKSFGIKTFEANTWDIANLMKVSKEAIDHARSGHPAFLLIKTYRLNPHSKGDDNRSPEEINFFRNYDVLSRCLQDEKWRLVAKRLTAEIDLHLSNNQTKQTLSSKDYFKDQLPKRITAKYVPVANKSVRMIQALNSAYKKTLLNGAFHIGEDIEDPYGGAFKVTKGFSSEYPSQVMGTPISEAALTGVAIGMSMMGTKTYAEIMFGDFMTHTFDQLISNASKFYHMYAFQTSAPVRIRTPMGGKRGYGPTHSQSLEKHFLGIDNVCVIALSSLIDPDIAINESSGFDCPIVIIESKVDYGRTLWESRDDFLLNRESKAFGALKLSPSFTVPTLTIVSYGESARCLADNLRKIFIETNFIPELICLIQLSPIDINPILKSIRKTNKLVIVEDGSPSFGIGSEIISQIAEANINLEFITRIGAEPVPIPSIIELEQETLPTINKIIKNINSHHKKAF